MHSTETSNSPSASVLPNGYGAAALLSAAIGSCALAVIAITADRIPAFGRLMTFYKPTGPLSGVTTSAILAWLVVWIILAIRWRRRNVRLGRVGTVAIVLLVISLLLMFPPIADLF